jgi:hypothetical protein
MYVRENHFFIGNSLPTSEIKKSKYKKMEVIWRVSIAKSQKIK